MKNNKMKKWTIGLLCTVLVLPLIYNSDIFAKEDETLEQMIIDHFVIVEEDGTTRTVPVEAVAAKEGDEISVADKYDVVTNIGGDIADVQTVETFDSKEEANEALEELAGSRSNDQYDVQPFDLSRSISTGVAYIKTSDVSEYKNVLTSNAGYTHGAYGVDAAYIGEFNGKIRVKFAGIVADFNRSDINVVNYSNNTEVSYYMVINGILTHHYVYGSSRAYASTRVGYALDYLKPDKKYYSYDGHYFYENYATMIKDYQNDTYAHSVNKDKPYYNYYQFLSHRTTTSWQANDFNTMSIDTMGTTSYNGSLFKDLGKEFIKHQNAYTVNALLMYGVAANESNWGRSEIARDKKNLFGHGAVDSNPYYGANGYKTTSDSIKYHAKEFVSEGYLDYNDWRHHGPHLGDKESGLNVKYASDPYWGEKAACRAYYADGVSKDYEAETIGIITGLLKSCPLYKEPSTSSTVVTRLTYLSNIPVVIVDKVESGGKTWYKILSDTALSSDRSAPDWKRTYDAKHDYLYIQADLVQIVHEGKNDTTGGSDIKDGSMSNNATGHNMKVDGSYIVAESDVVLKDINAFVPNAVVKKGTTTIKNVNDVLGTGYTVTVGSKKYTFIKYGDVNGDGKVNSGDTLALKQHIKNVKKISNKNYLKAADINKDGKINSGDSLTAKQHIMGVKKIVLK